MFSLYFASDILSLAFFEVRNVQRHNYRLLEQKGALVSSSERFLHPEMEL